MPRTDRPPAYRFHKACAVVSIHGKNHYLGKLGSDESHEFYVCLITRWKTWRPVASLAVSPLPNEGTLSINSIIPSYLEFAGSYYRRNDHPTGEIDNVRCALASLKKLFRRSLAQHFGPKDLELVRQFMIDDKLARKTTNSRISRVEWMFRWATKKGLVPSNTYYGLLAVDGLMRGRSPAKDTRYHLGLLMCEASP